MTTSEDKAAGGAPQRPPRRPARRGTWRPGSAPPKPTSPRCAAQAPVPAGTVMLRLVQRPGGPDALIRGGYTIATDPVPVPQHAVGMLLDAAADVGVTLEEA